MKEEEEDAEVHHSTNLPIHLPNTPGTDITQLLPKEAQAKWKSLMIAIKTFIRGIKKSNRPKPSIPEKIWQDSNFQQLIVKEEPKLFCRLFTLPEFHKKRCRMIIHTATLNDMPEKIGKWNEEMMMFQLPKIEDIDTLTKIEENEIVASFDFKYFFYQLKIPKELREYIGVYPGHTFTRLPMGWRFSTYFAQKIAENIVEEFLQKHQKYKPTAILVYIDNVYIKHNRNEGDIVTEFSNFVKSKRINLSEAKIIVDPKNGPYEGVVLGCDIKANNIRPAQKTAEKIQKIENCASKTEEKTGREWLEALGVWWRLAYVYKLHKAPYYHTMQITRNVSRLIIRKKLDEPIGKVTNEETFAKGREEITEFVKWIKKRKWRNTTIKETNFTPIRVYVDASLTGYGAVFMSERGIFRIISQRWEDDPLKKGRNPEPRDMPELESLAAQRILASNKRTCYRCQFFTDSGTLVDAWESKGARNHIVNGAVKLLLESKADVRHISSKNNPADYYSRL